MKVSIIIIGDEILLGQVTDTNSGTLARAMAPFGFKPVMTNVVGDDADAIREAVLGAMRETDVVLTTGGLGPTKDDITKTVMTEIFGGEMRLDPETSGNVSRVMHARGLEVNELTALQAMVPSSCRVIQNRVGTAPVMWFERDGKVVVNMPGVPFETREMFEGEVLQALCERFGKSASATHRHAIVTGMCESGIAECLAQLETSIEGKAHIAYLPSPGLVRLRVDSTDSVTADKALEEIVRLLDEHVIATSDLTPAQILLNDLAERQFTVATAESCTGGNIAHLITMVPGSSESMLGGVVSYANSVKTGVLGVSSDSLLKHGAVSREVVEQMASGICRVTGASLGIATSGIAGPGGGTAKKPVGTVWIATCLNGHVSSTCHHFAGNRSRVIDHASVAAVTAAIHTLRLHPRGM